MTQQSALTFNFHGNSQDVERALQRLESKYEKVIDQNEKLRRTTKRASKENVKALNEVKGATKAIIPQMGGLAAATLATVAQFNKLVASSEQFKKNIASTTVSFDMDFSNLLSQLEVDRGGKQAQKLEARIFDLSKKFGLDPQSLTKGMTEFISQGGNLDQLSGGAIESIIKTGLATNNRDFSSLGSSMISFLRETGKEVNEKNLYELGVKFRGAFKSNIFQSSDVESMKKVLSSLSGIGLSDNEIFAQSILAKETAGTSDAATEKLSQVVKSLTTRGDDKTYIKALKKIGLKKDQVDLTGESLNEALTLIGGNLNRLPQEEKLSVLKGLFGEAALFSQGLIAKQNRVETIGNDLNNPESFENAVKIQTTGAFATQNRIDSDKMRFNRQEGLNTINKRDVLKNVVSKMRQNKEISETVAGAIIEDVDNLSPTAELFTGNFEDASRAILAKNLAFTEYDFKKGFFGKADENTERILQAVLQELKRITNSSNEQLNIVRMNANFNHGNKPIGKEK